MTIQEAIESRHSVRSYTDQPLEMALVHQLHELIVKANQEGSLRIQLVVNDPKAFDCVMAKYGKFSNVRNYIAMIGSDAKDLDERIGYYGERLVLAAQMMGLNTCWVGLSFKKNPEMLHLRDGDKLRCVISLGYGKTQGSSHKIKAMDKVSEVKGKSPEWFRRGILAALKAPTAMNQQKFKFILKGENKVKAKAGLGFFSKVDLGIVKYHFEVAAGKDNFEWV